jgi:hypothetical protein
LQNFVKFLKIKLLKNPPWVLLCFQCAQFSSTSSWHLVCPALWNLGFNPEESK